MGWMTPIILRLRIPYMRIVGCHSVAVNWKLGAQILQLVRLKPLRALVTAEKSAESSFLIGTGKAVDGAVTLPAGGGIDRVPLWVR